MASIVLLLLMANMPQQLAAHCLDSVQTVNVREVFSMMPDSLFPYLSKNNRLDMLDFMDSNMKAEVKNRFDGSTEMLSLTDNDLRVQLNDASTMEVILLPVDVPVDNVNRIVCVLQTYANRESTLSFYSVKWHQLPTEDYLTEPMEGMSAQWDSATKTLSLTADSFSEMVALENQKITQKKLIKLQWLSKFYNKH